jgi:hypothetical protein
MAGTFRTLSELIGATVQKYLSAGATAATAVITASTVTGATVVYTVSGGGFGSNVTTLNYTRGLQYGVPGPELAGGLPFLAAAAAFAGYHYFRKARQARATAGE